MTENNTKTGYAQNNTNEATQQIKPEPAEPQQEIEQLKQKLESSKWRIEELESYVQMLVQASNEETLERAGLFKQQKGDFRNQILEACGINT